MKLGGERCAAQSNRGRACESLARHREGNVEFARCSEELFPRAQGPDLRCREFSDPRVQPTLLFLDDDLLTMVGQGCSGGVRDSRATRRHWPTRRAAPMFCIYIYVERLSFA